MLRRPLEPAKCRNAEETVPDFGDPGRLPTPDVHMATGRVRPVGVGITRPVATIGAFRHAVDTSASQLLMLPETGRVVRLQEAVHMLAAIHNPGWMLPPDHRWP